MVRAAHAARGTRASVPLSFVPPLGAAGRDRRAGARSGPTRSASGTAFRDRVSADVCERPVPCRPPESYLEVQLLCLPPAKQIKSDNSVSVNEAGHPI